MYGQKPSSAGKIALTCPHCGFKQLESPYTKSTFCRKCGQHYEPGRPAPAPPSKPEPTLMERMGQFLSGKKTREITCFDCGAVQTVSSSSTSSLCPQCSAYIDLTDFKINTAFSRMIQTQGTVTIGPKADVTSSKVACREALVEGKLRGNILCTGDVTIRYKGKMSGSVEARHILVAKGSDVDGVRMFKAKSVEIAGKIAVNLQIDGLVKITKRGYLIGDVRARGITIDKGGVFFGELEIGPPPPEPTENAEPSPESPPAEGNQGDLPFNA